MYVVGFKVERSLYYRPFRGDSHFFVVLVPECGPYSPRVSHYYCFSASGNGTYYVSPVPVWRRCAEDIGDIYMFLYVSGYFVVLYFVVMRFLVQFLVFEVEAVSQLFEQQVCVGVVAGMLPF